MTTVDKATSNSTMKNHQPQHCDVHLRQPCCVDCVSGASPNAQVAEPEKNEKEKKRNCFRHRGYITFLSNEGSSHLRHTRSRDVRGNAYTIGMFVDIVRWLFSFRFPNPKKKTIGIIQYPSLSSMTSVERARLQERLAKRERQVANCPCSPLSWVPV